LGWSDSGRMKKREERKSGGYGRRAALSSDQRGVGCGLSLAVVSHTSHEEERGSAPDERRRDDVSRLGMSERF